jgi:2'-5' RNA ligase
VAVWPPGSLVTRLRGLERPSRPGLRWTTEDQWHVTVRFFGSIDPASEATVRDALGRFAPAASALEATAGPKPRGLGRGVWVLPVEGLEPLAEPIARLTGGIGQPPGDRKYRGHITLARARRPAGLARLPTLEISGRWTVREVTLVRSDLRADGARYEVIGRWPLGDVGTGGQQPMG